VITLVQKSAPLNTLKQRQREVEEHLATFGLRRGPYRLKSRTISFEGDHIRRLRSALETLGPVFSSFGLYISTRIDLLSAEDCQELRCIRDRAPQSATASIRNLIKHEVGYPPEEIYRTFEETAFASRLLYQQHLATLSDGQPVIVKLIHPEAEEFLTHDLELLPLLKGGFLGETWSDSKIENAIEEFSQALRCKINFVQQASLAESLGPDTEVFGMLRVPLVYKQFSASRMLTFERLPGNSLENLISLFQEGNGTSTASGFEPADLSHRVGVAWLRQALLGSHYPVEPSPANITILPNGQVAFTDLAFASLTASTKANLWNYVIAVVTENPDHACSCLIREMEKGKDAVSESELRQRFRQMVPFRDCNWASSSGDNDLAPCLLGHWRLAGKHGYSARADVSSFFRSLVPIAGIAKHLVPHRDTLHGALQDVRLLAGVERCREMLSVQQLGEQMDKYLAIMTDLPQKIDDLLTLAAEGSERSKLQLDPGHQRSKKGSFVMLAWLVALVAVVLLSHRLTIASTGPWSSEISALAFVLLGAVLLRVSTRSG
jgi:ubiquinone biosynthesis protein